MYSLMIEKKMRKIWLYLRVRVTRHTSTQVSFTAMLRGLQLK